MWGSEEDAGSDVSEWERRERGEREEERRAEAEELGAAGELGAGEELLCSYPRPLSWHPQMRVGGGYDFLCFSFRSDSFPL